MLLLNRELIKNGFAPVMLDNPNRFDLFSVDELKKEINKGWENAEQYKNKIASLPEFKKIYEYVCHLDEKKELSGVFRKHSSIKKADFFYELLVAVKEKPLNEAAGFLETKLNEFKDKKYNILFNDLILAIRGSLQKDVEHSINSVNL